MSVFDIFKEKNNPLFDKLLQIVCDPHKYKSQFIEIDVDHKIMGSFNPCRFEMLQYT